MTAQKGQTQKTGDCYVCKGRKEARVDVKCYSHPLMLELSCKSHQTWTYLGDCGSKNHSRAAPKHFLLLSRCILHPAFPALKDFSVILEGTEKGCQFGFFFPAPINQPRCSPRAQVTSCKIPQPAKTSTAPGSLQNGRKDPGRCWAEPRKHRGISSSFSSLCWKC